LNLQTWGTSLSAEKYFSIVGAGKNVPNSECTQLPGSTYNVHYFWA
jgi:hypothetical protein